MNDHLIAAIAESRPGCNIRAGTVAGTDMKETGAETPSAEARRMLGIFASVGAERFHVTWTNSGGNPRRARSLRAALPDLYQVPLIRTHKPNRGDQLI